MFLLRKPILAVSDSTAVRNVVSRAPLTRAVVDRFVPGETTAEAVRGSGGTARQRAPRHPRLPRRGHHRSGRTADATVRAYLELIDALAAAGQVGGAEVTVKLSAVGQALPASDLAAGRRATPTRCAGAQRIADAAYTAGARMNLDMEDHTTVDSDARGAVRAADGPSRRRHRDPGDAAAHAGRPAELTGPGSRVRLVKGAYNEPAGVAFTDPDQIDLSYVRAMKVLMRGRGYPMIGSHDPRMVAIGEKLATDAGRGPDQWEYQMLYGIRPDEQERLVESGTTDAGVRPVRRGLVRLLHPPAGRTPGQPAVLPALGGLQEVTLRGWANPTPELLAGGRR